MFIYAKENKMSHMAFIFLDLICILVSFFLAYLLRYSKVVNIDVNLTSVYLQILIILMLSHVCIVYLFEMYTNIGNRGYFKEAKAVVENNLILMFVSLVYIYMTNQNQYARSVYIVFFIINITLMYAVRVFSKKMILGYLIKTGNLQKLLIVTTQKNAEKVVQDLVEKNKIDYTIRGIVIVDMPDLVIKKVGSIPVVANLDNIYEYSRLSVVDGVFIDIPENKLLEKKIVENFVDMGITVHINVSYVPVSIPNKVVGNMGKYTVVSGSVKIVSPSQMFMKRVMDIAGGIVGIFMMLIALVIVGPIIYLESPGPIFFTQVRVGRNGRKFKIYKFRSMYNDAEKRKANLINKNKMKGFMFKIDDDPRITKIGKFIRKTSIDELPQFINVLKGDMSLVGTRPPTVDEYEKYEPRHKKRLSIKPGITGIWQVNGRSNIIDFEDVVLMDTEYISNWSIVLDCKLLLKTIGVLFGDKNAS